MSEIVPEGTGGAVARAYDAACPFCGAAARERCIIQSGPNAGQPTKVSNVHCARADAASALQERRQEDQG